MLNMSKNKITSMDQETKNLIKKRDRLARKMCLEVLKLEKYGVGYEKRN